MTDEQKKRVEEILSQQEPWRFEDITFLLSLIDSLNMEMNDIERCGREQFNEMRAQITHLEAQLAHRHIIGKVYEVSRESINRLAGELDEARAELAKERDYSAETSTRLEEANERISWLEKRLQCVEIEKRTSIDQIKAERDRLRSALEIIAQDANDAWIDAREILSIRIEIAREALMNMGEK